MDNYEEKIESVLKRYRPTGPSAELKARIFGVREKGHRWIWLAVAASIALAASILIWQAISIPPNQEMAVEDIEQSISKSATAARLLAAADLLDQYQDARPLAEQQYRYIVSRYPETDAAAQAKTKIR